MLAAQSATQVGFCSALDLALVSQTEGSQPCSRPSNASGSTLSLSGGEVGFPGNVEAEAAPTSTLAVRVGGQAGGQPSLTLRLSAALLYKPVDRVTRSTLVLHVSPSGPGPPCPGVLGFCPGADTDICQFCPPAPFSATHLY